MRNDEVRNILFSIFETGVFYNAAMLAYKEQVRVFSHLEDILSTWSESNRTAVLESVNRHFMQQCSDLRKDILIPREHYSQKTEITAISLNINSNLNLPWPFFFY
jgi:hypothetical protein